MKNRIKQYLLAASMCVGLTACSDFFEPIPGVQFGLDETFASKQRTEEYLNNVYSYVREVTDAIHPNTYGGIFTEASLDGANRWNKTYAEWTNGSFNSASAQASEYFSKYYQAIAKASTFIQNVDKCTEAAASTRGKWKSEARALRAYYYFELLRLYGPIPLIGEDPIPLDASLEELIKERNSVDECVNFIATELQSAIDSGDLLQRAGKANLGRMDVATCMALKAKLYLYWASPLFNGNTDFFNVKDCYGNQLVSQTYDETKWAKAAAAAKDVIELAKASGLYELYVVAPKATVLPSQRPPHNALYSDKNYPEGWADVDPLLSYKSNFDGTILGSKNPELIFTRTRIGTGHINDWAYQSTPKTLKGNNRLAVTQKQVDAYAMNDGRSITEAEATGDYVTQGFTTQAYAVANPFLPAKVNLMYNNREPRFYASIAYNGSVWEASSASESEFRDQQIFYYRGLNDGKQGFKEECPLTGVTLKKFYNSEDSRTEGGYLVDKTEMTIRYGEILLIYAEALNELTSGQVYHLTTYTGADVEIQRSVDEMRYAIKRIRMRAGVPDYSEETYNNPNDFRVKLKRERQIELLGENSMRYFDLRRWKDAMTEENQLLQGCNINISDDETRIADFYKQTIITSVHKVFEQKMYLWPFPTYELKRNVNMTQNPEW